MNYESDLVTRLVDYHDHVAVPPVPVADDLRRGRRRVRRDRGLVAGGAAVALISVVAAVSVLAGESSVDRPQPAETPTGPLSSPLVAPRSPLEVRELGFHVEPGAGVEPTAEWNLAPDHQSTTVDWAGHELLVRVYYPSSVRPEWQLNVEPGQVVHGFDVNGVRGIYVEEFGRFTADGAIDSAPGACGAPPRGCDFWESELMWEFAPGSWASVHGIAGESLPLQADIRPTFRRVAEAVHSGGGLATRLPFRAGDDLGPLPPPTEAGVGVQAVGHPARTSGWLASFYGEPALSFSVGGRPCDVGAEADEIVQRFTYRGHGGCTKFYRGQLSGVVLRVNGVDRAIGNFLGGYGDGDLDDLKQWLLDLSVAALDDPSAWFDLTSALGG